MSELVKEIGILIIRTFTILPLMLFVTLMMGKRSIAELPVFDLLIVLTLGSVVGADLADPTVGHIPTAVAIVLLGLFQILVAKWKISNRKVGRLLTFEPTIVIHNGTYIVENIKKIRYSMDTIQYMLRGKDVFDVRDVQIGIIEANGQLTVVKMPNKSNVTIEDLNLMKNSASFSYPVIVEGTLYSDVLKKLNVTEEWLDEQLNQMDIQDINAIFFASINENSELSISLYKSILRPLSGMPPLYH